VAVSPVIAAAVLLALGAGGAQARVILQYFEGRWETIERRMPDIFMAGYGALWLPPASRADSGNQSVGFDVYDRFDLGAEFNPTLYGTESGLRALVKQAHRAGLVVYLDVVYNHNGFSDGRRGDRQGEQCALRWAIGEGGYPGFVMSGRDLGLPWDLEFRDICGSSANCDTDPVYCRVANLIDINHDTNYRWIRHPVEAGNPANIPYQEYRISSSNRRFYPDLDLPADEEGVHPFNTDDPMQGDAVEENVNMMLMRYTQWLMQSVGVNGFRIDAMKHISAGWYWNIYDFAAHTRARDFWGRPETAFSFGEYVESNWDSLRVYHRKDGYGNRTVLDFTLKFVMNNNIANPSGDFSAIVRSSADGIDDGDSENGTAAVQFTQSHDTGYLGDPPALPNLAYACILGRRGYPVVYYNPQEFFPTLGRRDFPNNNGRGDALGGRYGEIITRLVNIHNNFITARGGNDYRSLWHDNDFVAYELNNTLIVGLCDRDDRGSNGKGYEERYVDNFGFRNVTLVEISGNATDAVVDPADNIRDTITIPASGGLGFRVPTNENMNGQKHGRPYVMYSILPPQPVRFANAASDAGLRLLNAAATLPADGDNVPDAVARRIAVDVVTSDTARVELRIDPGAGSPEDNALIRWNYGLNIDGRDEGDHGIACGIDNALLAGYDDFTTKSPVALGGTGVYRVDVDLRNPAIPEGFNYISAIAFVQRISGLPPIFNTFRKVIYVDRRPPDARLVAPANPTGGEGDIPTYEYEFIAENPDATACALHYFWNLAAGTDPVASRLAADENLAARTDRSRWRFTLSGLRKGPNQRLALVFIEETGRYSVTEFLIGGGAGGLDPTPTVAPSDSPTPSPSPSPAVTATPEENPTPAASPTPNLLKSHGLIVY